MFKVTIAPRAEKEFAKLALNLKQKFFGEFKKLSVNPLNHPNVKKLRNTEFGYRLRIGRWRILFALFSKERNWLSEYSKEKKRYTYFGRSET